jgi:flagellar hook assembly protein FlgD
LYRNGVLLGTSDDDLDGPQAPPTAWHIGRSGVGSTLNSRWWAGDLDEVRISRTARSANYMKLSYESQKAAQTLTNIGVAVTVPRAPSGVIAFAGSGFNTISVSWTAPEENGGAAITQYTAYAISDPTKSCTTANLTCTISGLPAGSYTFSVRATNSAGQSLPSPPSEFASPTVGLAPGVGNSLFRVTGGPLPYSFRIPGALAATTERLSLTIFDTYGRTVWSGSVRPSTGQNEISWNGRAASGARAPAGFYLARVQAVDKSGKTVEGVYKGTQAEGLCVQMTTLSFISLVQDPRPRGTRPRARACRARLRRVESRW